MGFVDVVTLAGVLGGLGVVSFVVMRSHVRYLRRQAEDKPPTERDRLLRDFLKFGGGGF